MLSDVDIRDAVRNGVIQISPFDDMQVRPASYDTHLSGHWLAYYPWIGEAVHPIIEGDKSVEELNLMESFYSGDYYLKPHGCVLATTQERITLDQQHIARIEGRSSWGRMFATAHVTAGFCDPGYVGNPTLEIVNLSPCTIRLKAGMSIAQIAFERLDSPSSQMYSGKYNGAAMPQASRMKW